MIIRTDGEEGRLVIYHTSSIDGHGISAQERAVVASKVVVGRV
jgi:hypothetical protein